MLRYSAALGSPHRNNVLREVLAGKRRWTLADCQNDAGLFGASVIQPLRELKYEGIVGALNETEVREGDRSRIIAVEILGKIAPPPGADHRLDR